MSFCTEFAEITFFSSLFFLEARRAQAPQSFRLRVVQHRKITAIEKRCRDRNQRSLFSLHARFAAGTGSVCLSESGSCDFHLLLLVQHAARKQFVNLNFRCKMQGDWLRTMLKRSPKPTPFIPRCVWLGMKGRSKQAQKGVRDRVYTVVLSGDPPHHHLSSSCHHAHTLYQSSPWHHKG